MARTLGISIKGISPVGEVKDNKRLFKKAPKFVSARRWSDMKVLKISLLLLMAFSLTTTICYAQTAEDYFDKGIDYGVAGKFEKAQQEFTKALETDPFYAPATLGLNLSEDALKGRIKVETAVHLFKGIVYLKKGMYDEAIAECKDALEINPNLAEAHNNLAVSYYYKGKYKLAIKHCDRAIELGYEVHPELLKALEPDPPRYRFGWQVEILYNPSSPNNAKIKSFISLWGGVVGIGILGLVFFSIGFGTFLHQKIKANTITKLFNSLEEE